MEVIMVYGWYWIALIVLAIIIEIFTDQLISIWFIPGAIIAVILDFCSVPFIWQILSVLILAILGIFLARKLIFKNIPKESTKTNIDAIVGEKCIVTEKIDNYAGCGQVKIKGQIWSARGVGEDDVFDVGEILSVVAIEGVKVICKK
jgi:membrane protein implicated in regulation of membrane protease activity